MGAGVSPKLRPDRLNRRQQPGRGPSFGVGLSLTSYISRGVEDLAAAVPSILHVSHEGDGERRQAGWPG